MLEGNFVSAAQESYSNDGQIGIFGWWTCLPRLEKMHLNAFEWMLFWMRNCTALLIEKCGYNTYNCCESDWVEQTGKTSYQMQHTGRADAEIDWKGLKKYFFLWDEVICSCLSYSTNHWQLPEEQTQGAEAVVEIGA